MSMRAFSRFLFSYAMAFLTLNALASAEPIHRVQKPNPNSYIVLFVDGSNAAADPDTHVADLRRKYGVKVVHTYRTGIKGFSFIGTDAQANAINTDSRVRLVEEDSFAQLQATRSAASWGLDRIDQPLLPLDGGYTSSYTGAWIAIYVIDSGIGAKTMPTPMDLSGRLRESHNFVSVDGVIDPNDVADCYFDIGHGTPIASIAAGRTQGIATGAIVINLRASNCSGQLSYADLIAAVDWMTEDHLNNHAFEPAVANMSFSGPILTAFDESVMRAVQSGITVIAGAGNDARDACTSTPAHLSSLVYGVITVGATGGDWNLSSPPKTQTRPDDIAPYSNWGRCVTLFAPGSLVYSYDSQGYFRQWSGTSFAAPHVAGVAALYMERMGLTNSPATMRGLFVDNATQGVINGLPSGTANLLLFNGFVRRRACCG